MNVLRIGSKGDDVTKWQYFLTGQGFEPGPADGKFGDMTKTATIAFQKRYGLQADGVVGNKTIGQAMLLGFGVVANVQKDKSGENWPAKPTFKALSSNAEREKIFGKFAYRHQPVPGNYENIVVTDNWAKDNIVSVDIPQLRRITTSTKIQFHQSAAKQLQKLWSDWEKAGLLHLLITYNGSYVPRFVRGKAAQGILSNHAFGTAFDINVAWNQLGVVPALVGEYGSVRELVPIANDNGFFWGGHYSSRLDGMHFEVAVVKK